MNPRFWKYLLYCCLIWAINSYESVARQDPIRDSLRNLVSQAEGRNKVDRMLELGNYELSLHNNIVSLNITKSALKLAKKLNYAKGLALSYRYYGGGLLGLEKYSEAESKYLESLKIFRQLYDSAGMFSLYIDLTIVNTFSGDYKNALSYANKAKKIAVILKDPAKVDHSDSYISLVYNVFGKSREEEYTFKRRLLFYAQQSWSAAKLYIELGRFYVGHGKYAEGIDYFRKADSAIAVRKDMEGMDHADREFMRAKQTGNIARAYRLWGHYDTSLFYHRLSVKQMYSCPIFNEADIANQYEGIGIIYTQWGVFDSARYYFQQSINLRKKCDDHLGIGFCYDGMGYISWLLGDYQGATRNYFKALAEKALYKPYFRLVNRVFSSKEGLSISHLRLGMVYADWNYPETALDEYNKSLNLCREIGFKSGETEALIGIGKLYIQMGKFREAHLQFKQAYSNSKIAGDIPSQALILKNWGNLLVRQGDYKGGLEYFHRAEAIGIKVGNPVEMVEINLCIGKTLSRMGLFDEGEKKLLESLKQAEKLRISRWVQECHDNLANLYEQSGKTSLALYHFECGTMIRDSIYNRKTSLFLADINQSNEEKKLRLKLNLLLQNARLKDAEFRDEQNRLFGLAGLGLLFVVLVYMFTGTRRMHKNLYALQLRQRLFIARLNPEFINNSLNDIKAFIENSESGRAVSYLAHFARYIQHVLLSTRNESVPVKNEITMIESFLNLKKSAYKDRFDYILSIEDDAEDLRIIPLLIQPALEKAVDRVLNGNHVPGILIITVSGRKSSLLFIIEDNGRPATGIHSSFDDKKNQSWNRVEIEIPYFKVQKVKYLFPKILKAKSLVFLLLVVLTTVAVPLVFSEETNSPVDSIVKDYHSLYVKNKQQGNFEGALIYFKLYNTAKDSLDRLNRNSDLRMLARKYKNDTKEQQINFIAGKKTLREFKLKQLRYSVFGLTGLLMTGGILVLLFFNRSRVRMNQQTLNTEQYLLRSQMNPHFIFNALTNIQALILQHDREASLRYLGLFSDLTGKILESSGMELVQLEDELSIITNYIKLQKLRYRDKFEVSLSGMDEPGIKEILIPPMLLQPFVENAIEHGLKYKEGKGLLSVRILKNEPEGIFIEIEDDGIGRIKSKEIHAKNEDKHQGLATAISYDRIDRLNRNRRKKISLEITDLETVSGNIAGTLVRIIFPQPYIT